MQDIIIYLGSGKDSLLDVANYLKTELPHFNIHVKPINQLNNGKCIRKARQPR